MHIPYSDNKNIALFGEQNKTVPLVYFNIINLKKGESYNYKLPEDWIYQNISRLENFDGGIPELSWIRYSTSNE